MEKSTSQRSTGRSVDILDISLRMDGLSLKLTLWNFTTLTFALISFQKEPDFLCSAPGPSKQASSARSRTLPDKRATLQAEAGPLNCKTLKQIWITRLIIEYWNISSPKT